MVASPVSFCLSSSNEGLKTECFGTTSFPNFVLGWGVTEAMEAEIMMSLGLFPVLIPYSRCGC